MLISCLVLSGHWRISDEEGLVVESFVITLFLAAAEAACEVFWLVRLFGG